MKTNFLVTAHPAARVPDAQRVLAIDPYIVHVLEQNGDIGRYRDVATVTRSRTTREAFERDHDFVRGKFHRHVQLLAQRLNEVHGSAYDLRFWKKALSLGPLRHISLCFDLFQACEANLSPEQHECRILADACFFVPRDFNEHRRFFQHSDFGQEQLFSTYCRLFHPGRFQEWRGRHQWPGGAGATVPARRTLWARIVSLPKRMARRLLRIRRPVVGIINSYFSAANVDTLLRRSFGKIQKVALPAATTSTGEGYDWDKRDRLARRDDDFDRFDEFVFATLRHAMPRALVEDAEALIDGYRRFFSEHYPGMRWVVSEAWIGDMYTSVALAVLEQAGVRHLYNEHNYFAHPFVGNNLQFLVPLVDQFATLGWRSDDDQRIVPAASLFGWTAPGAYDPHGPVLFVSSLPQVRAAEISACYGEAGAVNVPRYFEMVETFLMALPEKTRGELLVRAYPTTFPRVLQAWDFKYRLRDCLAGVKRVDDSEGGARSLMRSARLVVLDYISTSFIESMLMDLPTVFLWNTRTRYLLDAYEDFFAPLQHAGICQSDPAAAARFVESIKDDPARWWHQAETRAAREEFFATNLGQPQVLVEHLLQLSRAG